MAVRARAMWVFLFVVLVVLDLRRSAAAEDSRMALCKADLSSFLPVPFSNMTETNCAPVWNNFVLRYLQSDDNVLTIILSAPYTTGWVGIAFSKEGRMIGSSAMVGWISREAHASIKQYYLRATVASEVIPNKGELPLTNVPPAVVVHEATIYLAFQMKFPNRVTKQPILLAFGTKHPVHHRLSHHDDRISIAFDFSGGSVAVLNKGTDSMRRNHGILGIISWGLILPVGAMAPRYFKHKDPLWFHFHVCFQFLGFLIGLATVVLGKVLYDKLNANISAHRGIGITVLTLSILQISAYFLRPHKDAKNRKYWNWYHNWVGRIALFLGAVNIVLGMDAAGAGKSWKIGYGFLLAFVLATVIVFEVLLRLRRRDKTTQPAFQMDPI
ncbi:hypothetical protein Syun_019559 [Stephania yunnanensis]|uniref:Cytochrome b561 and DOMON domain-containing protein n=1 Tax=Stephania yunnanensis TaxID=152371 RepID=A0AAP0NW07_9MAGN